VWSGLSSGGGVKRVYLEVAGVVILRGGGGCFGQC
jgi:hypothetical protein